MVASSHCRLCFSFFFYSIMHPHSTTALFVKSLQMSCAVVLLLFLRPEGTPYMRGVRIQYKPTLPAAVALALCMYPRTVTEALPTTATWPWTLGKRSGLISKILWQHNGTIYHKTACTWTLILVYTIDSLLFSFSPVAVSNEKKCDALQWAPYWASWQLACVDPLFRFIIESLKSWNYVLVNRDGGLFRD